MRRLLPFISIWLFALTACGAGMSSSNEYSSGQTGFQDRHGNPFVTSDGRINDPGGAPGPAAPNKPQPKVILAQRLKDFELARYDKGSKELKRFGGDSVGLRLYYTNEASVNFATKLGGGAGTYSVEASASHYSVRGSLIDDDPYQTLGDFEIKDTSNGETARLYYEAYKAILKIHEDADHPVQPGSWVDQQLQRMRLDTFAWVHNWAVKGGRARYSIDIITSSHEPGMLFQGLKGESLKTGDKQFDASAVGGDGTAKTQLYGNGIEASIKIFTVTLTNPKDKSDTYTFTVDVIKEHDDQAARDDDAPDAPAAVGDTTDFDNLDSSDIPADNSGANGSGASVSPSTTVAASPGPAGNGSSEDQIPATGDSQNGSTPASPGQNNSSLGGRVAPQPAPRPAGSNSGGNVNVSHDTPSSAASQQQVGAQGQVAPIVRGTSYLRVDLSRPQTARMVHDYNMNRKLQGVRKAIDGYRSRRNFSLLESYYFYANPFRRIFEAIGAAFDVAPTFAFLPVNESAYFTDGKYWSTQPGDSGAAMGPFQFHVPAAQSSGLEVDRSLDERRYFAPSACGAAKYMIENYKTFSAPGKDSTLMILGYNQGGAGAQSFARRYSYNYKELSYSSSLPDATQQYVDNILAIFFISADFVDGGFSLRGAPTHLPSLSSIVPQGKSGFYIHDPQCRAVVAPLLR